MWYNTMTCVFSWSGIELPETGPTIACGGEIHYVVGTATEDETVKSKTFTPRLSKAHVRSEGQRTCSARE